MTNFTSEELNFDNLHMFRIYQKGVIIINFAYVVIMRFFGTLDVKYFDVISSSRNIWKVRLVQTYRREATYNN